MITRSNDRIENRLVNIMFDVIKRDTLELAPEKKYKNYSTARRYSLTKLEDAHTHVNSASWRIHSQLSTVGSKHTWRKPT
jgi:hypothetical protein